jgi:hypothetical protein
MEKNKQRDTKGRYLKGTSGNLAGRRALTEQEKIINKLTRAMTEEIIKEYQQRLVDILPEIPEILRNKVLQGDLQAIKEINNRTMGLPKATIDLQVERSISQEARERARRALADI